MTRSEAVEKTMTWGELKKMMAPLEAQGHVKDDTKVIFNQHPGMVMAINDVSVNLSGGHIGLCFHPDGVRK